MSIIGAPDPDDHSPWAEYMRLPFEDKLVVTPDFCIRYGGRPTHTRDGKRIREDEWTELAIAAWCERREVPEGLGVEPEAITNLRRASHWFQQHGDPT